MAQSPDVSTTKPAVGAAKRGIQRPGPPKSIVYFLVFAFAAPGAGLATAAGTLPLDARLFCLEALGFLASRLPLFWPTFPR